MIVFEYIPEPLLTYASRTGRTLKFKAATAHVRRDTRLVNLREGSVVSVNVDAERTVLTPGKARVVLDFRNVMRNVLKLYEAALILAEKDARGMKKRERIKTLVTVQNYLFNFKIRIENDGRNVFVRINGFYANMLDEPSLDDVSIDKSIDDLYTYDIPRGVEFRLTGGVVDNEEVTPFSLHLEVFRAGSVDRGIIYSEHVAIVLPTQILIDYDVHVDINNVEVILVDQRRAQQIVKTLEGILDVLTDVLLYVD